VFRRFSSPWGLELGAESRREGVLDINLVNYAQQLSVARSQLRRRDTVQRYDAWTCLEHAEHASPRSPLPCHILAAYAVPYLPS
jgi:hypothetical protein